MTAVDECLSVLPGYDPWRDAEDYEFIPELAEEKIAFIENNIVHTEGVMAGKPYILAPHQRAIISMIYGWRHKVTGFRRITEALFYVPRKNSKSTDCAVILNTEMCTCPDWRQQNYSSGRSERMAQIVYKIMRAQIRANPEMGKRFRIYESPRSIVRLADDTIYQPLPADGEMEHGKNVHFALCDETHTYRSGDVVVALRTGMAAQDEPLLMHATTADYLRESFCNDLYDYAVKVRDGEIRNPNFLPIIYEADPERVKADPDYWKTEEAWKEANPLYGISVRPSFLRAECQRAIDDPSYENEFKRLHLNIRTESSERMISSERWSLNDGVFPDGYFDGKEVVAAALDCGATTDATSLCLLFDKERGNQDAGFDAKWFHWMPRAKAIEYETKYGKPFSEWDRDGWCKLTDGDQIDYEMIRAELNGIAAQFPIKELQFDPLFQSIQLGQQLVEDGWEIEAFKCNMLNLTAPTAELLRLINVGKFGHGNNPFMRDQSGNAVLKRRAEYMMPDKAKSTGKIDGIVTAAMCIAIAMRNRAGKKSVYEQRGAFVLGGAKE